MRRTPPVLLLIGVLAPCLVHGQPAVRPTGITPPRLALVEGTASFWRPGASDWSRAVVNTPLGTGDALFAERDSSVEVQIGPAAYLRLAATTYVELSDVTSEHLQVKLVRGEASLDLRELVPRSVEVDTPQAAFTLDRPGYYRLHVDSRSATLIVRRGGGALLTPGNAPSDTVRSGEEVVVESDGAVHHFAAPDLDAWDQWSLARSDRLLDALSARYVADGIYGVADLDQAGSWRQVPEYGAVWLPDAVPPGWTPFSTGQWIYDTTFGWSWIDDAPWGWAPSHHGRWVSVDGRWAWAPGPPDVVPAYAPAVVGWLEGGPGIGWVPLGWGEPIFPWWGAAGATGVASWAGWGGPWFVNRAPMQQRGAVYASNMSYANASIPGAVVATRADRLGRGDREHTRTTPGDVSLMRPRDVGPGVNPVAASLLPTTERGTKPGSSLTQQRVRATRMPPDAGARLRELGLKVPGTAVVHLVLQPPRAQLSTGDRPPEMAAADEASTDRPAERASAGDQERARPPRAPGFIDWLNGVDAAELASRRVPRDLFASPWSGESAWRSNRGFEPPMGEPYRTDLPGEPGMRLRPSGGVAGFAVAEGERKEPSAAAPPPRPAPAPPPPVAVALAPTTSSTMVVPSTTLPSTAYVPPTVTTTTYEPVTTIPYATPTTFVTATTLAAPPVVPTAAPPPAEFQPCTAVGDVCGPCGPRGEMAACMRQIGKLSPICALPDSCVVMDCLWDSDCGTGRRCVQNAHTMQTNCCDECTEVVREHMPRYVTLSSTTTTVVPAPAPTDAPAPTWAPAPPPTYAPPPPTYAPAVTTTTVYVSAVVPPPATGAAPAFTPCTTAGTECGPCPPGNRMSKCARRMGSEAAICAQPDTCFASWCVWDRDCGPGRRCVLNPDTLQTNCCQECKGLGDDDLFDVVTTTTTLPSAAEFDAGTTVTTLPPSGGEFYAGTTATTLPPGFEPCAFTGDLCGPCEPSGFRSTCHREIGSTRAFCPKPGSCVEINCESNADCLSNQRCVFNNNTMLSNCCEACVPAASDTPPSTVVPASTTSTTVRKRQSIF